MELAADAKHGVAFISSCHLHSSENPVIASTLPHSTNETKPGTRATQNHEFHKLDRQDNQSHKDGSDGPTNMPEPSPKKMAKENMKQLEPSTSSLASTVKEQLARCESRLLFLFSMLLERASNSRPHVLQLCRAW